MRSLENTIGMFKGLIMVKALAMRELVMPGLLLDHSLRSFNSFSCDRSCSWLHLQLPWIDTGCCSTGAQCSGAKLEHLHSCWSLPWAFHFCFMAGFACRSCCSLSEFWQFSSMMITYSATSEPLAPSCQKNNYIFSWNFPVYLPGSFNLPCLHFVNWTKH